MPRVKPLSKNLNQEDESDREYNIRAPNSGLDRASKKLKSKSRPTRQENYRCTDRNVRSKRMSLIQDLSGDENEGSPSDSPVEKVSIGKKDMDVQRDNETTNDEEDHEGQEVSTNAILQSIRKSQTAILQNRSEHRTLIAILKSKGKLHGGKAYNHSNIEEKWSEYAGKINSDFFNSKEALLKITERVRRGKVA